MIDLPEEVTILGGGTGTPKLLWRSDSYLEPATLTVVANTADDVEFGDLFICPDIDSCLFTAADRIDTELWWGLTGDSTVTADALGDYTSALQIGSTPRYRPDAEQVHGRHLARWRRFEPIPEFMTFGDEDRAIHRARAAAIDRGLSLTTITRRLAEHLGVEIDVLPMSDDPVATWIETDDGWLHFQDYWVARRGNATPRSVEFRGIESAETTDAVEDALDADAVIIGPSNPITSIGPILALPGVRDRLENVPVIVVSPFLGEEVFSGPAADLMAMEGYPVGTPGLSEVYPFADGFILDETDQTEVITERLQTDIRIDEPADARRIWEVIAAAIEGIG